MKRVNDTFGTKSDGCGGSTTNLSNALDVDVRNVKKKSDDEIGGLTMDDIPSPEYFFGDPDCKTNAFDVLMSRKVVYSSKWNSKRKLSTDIGMVNSKEMLRKLDGCDAESKRAQVGFEVGGVPDVVKHDVFTVGTDMKIMNGNDVKDYHFQEKSNVSSNCVKSGTPGEIEGSLRQEANVQVEESGVSSVSPGKNDMLAVDTDVKSMNDNDVKDNHFQEKSNVSSNSVKSATPGEVESSLRKEANVQVEESGGSSVSLGKKDILAVDTDMKSMNWKDVKDDHFQEGSNVSSDSIKSGTPREIESSLRKEANVQVKESGGSGVSLGTKKVDGSKKYNIMNYFEKVPPVSSQSSRVESDTFEVQAVVHYPGPLLSNLPMYPVSRSKSKRGKGMLADSLDEIRVVASETIEVPVELVESNVSDDVGCQVECTSGQIAETDIQDLNKRVTRSQSLGREKFAKQWKLRLYPCGGSISPRICTEKFSDHKIAGKKTNTKSDIPVDLSGTSGIKPKSFGISKEIKRKKRKPSKKRKSKGLSKDPKNKSNITSTSEEEVVQKSELSMTPKKVSVSMATADKSKSPAIKTRVTNVSDVSQTQSSPPKCSSTIMKSLYSPQHSVSRKLVRKARKYKKPLIEINSSPKTRKQTRALSESEEDMTGKSKLSVAPNKRSLLLCKSKMELERTNSSDVSQTQSSPPKCSSKTKKSLKSPQHSVSQKLVRKARKYKKPLIEINSSPKTRKRKRALSESEGEVVESGSASKVSRATRRGRTEVMAPMKLAPIFCKNGKILSTKGKENIIKLTKGGKDRNQLVKTNTQSDKSLKHMTQERYQFLHSGIPDSLIKVVQTAYRSQNNFNVYPDISHVQQREQDDSMWNLPDKTMYFPPRDIHSPKKNYLGNLSMTSLLETRRPSSKTNTLACGLPKKIKSFAPYLSQLKEESPDFPVHRMFRNLRKKNGSSKPTEEPLNRSEQHIRVPISKSQQQVWTEKYGPSSAEEMIGNVQSLQRLKKWLEMCKKMKDDIKDNFDESCSEDEFIGAISDDERKVASEKMMIIVGPSGSGKTAGVYAVANELSYKVLEVNASSKRSGRIILSELQEATQSHHVQSNGTDVRSTGISQFFQPKAVKKAVPVAETQGVDEDANGNKLSLILIDDADIVFEEDDGFVQALSTLVKGSKRPVVLVTTDENCAHLTRFMNSNQIVEFVAAPCTPISIWLQMVCLVEYTRVDLASIKQLLTYNNYDVRRTLLQLQFWVLSGGDPIEKEDKMRYPVDSKINESNGKQFDPIHYVRLQTLIGSFNNVPFDLLGHIWWDMPNLLKIPYTKHVPRTEVCRHDISVPAELNVESVSTLSNGIPDDDNIPRKIKQLSQLYETLCAIDVINSKCQSEVQNFEPCQRAWESIPKCSTTLEEKYNSEWNFANNISQDMCHWLSQVAFRDYNEEIQDNSMHEEIVYSRKPSQDELRWRSDQHATDNLLWKTIPSRHSCSRRALVLDYGPSLRSLCRVERDTCVPTLRHQRRRYFGLNVTESNLNTLTSVFKDSRP